jgi:hypothetical protein
MSKAGPSLSSLERTRSHLKGLLKGVSRAAPGGRLVRSTVSHKVSNMLGDLLLNVGLHFVGAGLCSPVISPALLPAVDAGHAKQYESACGPGRPGGRKARRGTPLRCRESWRRLGLAASLLSAAHAPPESPGAACAFPPWSHWPRTLLPGLRGLRSALAAVRPAGRRSEEARSRQDVETAPSGAPVALPWTSCARPLLAFTVGRSPRCARSAPESAVTVV